MEMAVSEETAGRHHCVVPNDGPFAALTSPVQRSQMRKRAVRHALPPARMRPPTSPARDERMGITDFLFSFFFWPCNGPRATYVSADLYASTCVPARPRTPSFLGIHEDQRKNEARGNGYSVCYRRQVRFILPYVGSNIHTHTCKLPPILHGIPTLEEASTST